MTTKFYATTDANGLISHELNATTKSEAIAEVKAAVVDRSATDWVDGTQLDIEDELGVNCNNMSHSEALEACIDAGADFVWGEQTGDSWDIWSVETE